MRIIFTGSGEYGVPTLAGLQQAGHEIVLVFTQPDRPAGRGRKLTPTPIGQFAIDHSLPLIRTSDFNVETLPAADAMVVVAFGQKIGVAAVNHPRLGSVNLHSSRLPKFRGAAPINWAILRGEQETGNSIIRLTAKMDAGAILAQSSIVIGESETAGELHDRLAVDGAALMIQTLGDLEAGKIVELSQDESLATAAPKLTRETARIDWSGSAESIARQIRGLHPWPGCRVRLLDAAGGEVARLTLVRAKVGESEGSRWQLGEIESFGMVCTGDGAIEILELQPEGKNPMKLADYRRGNTWMPGLRLESL